MTDPVPISSEYTEDEQRSLSLIYLDYSRDLPPYVSKNTTEASLLSATINPLGLPHHLIGYFSSSFILYVGFDYLFVPDPNLIRHEPGSFSSKMNL